MKKSSVALASVLFAGAVFAACTLVPNVVLPMVSVSSMATQEERLQQIASHVRQYLGPSSLGSEILQVRIPTQTCLLGICGATLEVSFLKPCGQDAAEAFLESASGGTFAGGGGGGSGGDGTPGHGGGGGYVPPGGGGGGWACTSSGSGPELCYWVAT